VAAGKHILIVEDDQYIRDSLIELLEDEGYKVSIAKNGQEGLDQLRSGLQPNLILLDLMMPIKDGFQFRDEQGADPKLAKIPTIIFSADTGVNQPHPQFVGATLLKKPVDLDALLEVVEKNCAATPE
jgi:CheY-like chemotaxis protein